MCSIDFFSSNEIQNELKCLFCENEFDIPLILPCGKTICRKCESNFFSSRNNAKTECNSCKEIHQLPKNGFPINDLIQKLLKKTPVRIYRGEIHKNTMMKINDVGLINSNFDNGVQNSESMVRNYCDLLRNKVDIKTESTVELINQHRDDILNKIAEYESNCLNKCANSKEFKDFISECHKKHRIWVNFINQANLNDSEIERVFKESNELINLLNSKIAKFNYFIFDEKKLHFYDNKKSIDSTIIGKLSNTGSGAIEFDQIIEKKLFKTINYKTEKKAISFLNHQLIEINKDLICVIVSTNESNGQNGYNYTLKLKLFSNLGGLDKEIKEQIYSSENFCSSKFNNLILISYGHHNGSCRDIITNRVTNAASSICYSLKTYDYDLVVKQNINLNYNLSSISTYDNKIFGFSSSNNYWYIFDENLKQIEQISATNGQSYPFILNQTSQICFNYDKIFSFFNAELRIIDNQNRTLFKTIKFDQKYNDNKKFIMQPISSDSFVIINRLDKYFELFNFELECLVEFKINNINEITSSTISDSGHLVIFDNTTTSVYVI